MFSFLRSVLLSWLPATLPLRAPLSQRFLLGVGSPRRRFAVVLCVSVLVQNIVSICCHSKLVPYGSHPLRSERTSRRCAGHEFGGERRCGAKTTQPSQFPPSISGVSRVFPMSPSSPTISPQLSCPYFVDPSLETLCVPFARNPASVASAFSRLKGAHAWVCAAAQPSSLSSAVPQFGAASCLPVSSLLISSFTSGSPASTPTFQQNRDTAFPCFAHSSFAAFRPSFMFCYSPRSRCASCSSFVFFLQLSTGTTKSRAYSPFAPFPSPVSQEFHLTNVRRGTVSFGRVRGESARNWHSALSSRKSVQLNSYFSGVSGCPRSTAPLVRSSPSLTFWWSESCWTRGLARLPSLSLFSGSLTPCLAATTCTPRHFQVFYPFDYICLTSPEASRIFASSWEEAVSAAVLSWSSHLSFSRSSPSSSSPSSLGPHASSYLSLPLPLLLPGSIVCVGEGTRRAAEEALVEAFLRLLAIRRRTERSGYGSKDGENGAATGQRDSQRGASVDTRGRDCANGLVSQLRGQQREQTNPTYGKRGGRSQKHSRERERKLEAAQEGQDHQEALAHIRTFFSSFAPSTATGASLAEELPPRPPILSMLSAFPPTESSCSSPLSFAFSPPPRSAVPSVPVHAQFPSSVTTIADSESRPEVAREVHNGSRPGSSLCPYCCLRTRVLWPTSALSSDLLSSQLEQRKLSELSRVVLLPGGSLLTGGHSDQDVARNNGALVHGNADVARADGEALQAGMARSAGTGIRVGTMESVAVSQLLKAVLGAKAACPPQSVPAIQRIIDGNHLSPGVCPLDNEAGEDSGAASSGTDRVAERESIVNWDLLPAFSVQRLNIYTTAQRMLSVDERQALIGHIRHAVARNEACGPNGACENVSMRCVKKGAASSCSSGEEEAKNQPEEKGFSAVLVMLGSPSAVWSWVANGLPLSTAALCSPELPSYTAVHAGARQFHFPVDSPVAASLSSSSSSSYSGGGPSAQASLPPKAASTTLYSPASGTAAHGVCASSRDIDAGRPQVTTISRKADFARLLDEFRTALSAGQERRLRSRRQPEQLVAVAIGPSTAAAARQAGFAKVIVAARPGLESWADAVVKAAKRIVKEGKRRSQTPQPGRTDKKDDEQVRGQEAIVDVKEKNHDTIVTKSSQAQRRKRVSSRLVATAEDAHEKVEAIQRQSEAMWQDRRGLHPVTPARQNRREAAGDGQQHPDENVASSRIVVLLTREQSKNGAVVEQLKKRGDVDVRESTLLSSPDGAFEEVTPEPFSEEDTAKQPQQV
ncbi:transmembrane protein, partial [Cystoisospora suis]